MTDKPILFSAPMVRALLDGRKTQTRMVLKPQPDPGGIAFMQATPSGQDYPVVERRHPYGDQMTCKPAYAPGDRLCVREAWSSLDGLDPMNVTQMARQCVEEAGYPRPWAPIQYEADGARDNWIREPHGFGMEPGRYRHARFMPRWASRLTLTVTDVRVQRLQEISSDECYAEGVVTGKPYESGDEFDCFRAIWNSINGPDAWDANPWVVALTFDVHHCNIDQMDKEA